MCRSTDVHVRNSDDFAESHSLCANHQLRAYYTVFFTVTLCYAPRIYGRVLVIALAVVTCGVASYAYLSGISQQGRLTLSDQYNPTWFAATSAAVALALLVVLFNSSSRMLRWLLGALAVVLGATILSCQARNAMFAVVAGLFLGNVLVVLRRSKWLASRRVIGALVISMAIVCGALFVLQEKEYVAQLLGEQTYIETDRFVALLEEDASGATAGRWDIWAEYIDAIWRGEMFAGPNQAYIVTGVGHPPHNVYLSLLVDLGPPALIAFLCVGTFVVYRLWRLGTSSWILAFVIYLPALGVGNDVLYYKYWWFGLCLCSLAWQVELERYQYGVGQRRH